MWYGVVVYGSFYFGVGEVCVNGVVEYYDIVIKGLVVFGYYKWCVIYVFNVIGNYLVVFVIYNGVGSFNVG